MFICHNCQKEFNCKSEYDRHINKKKSCINELFICHNCQKEFNCKSDYDRHINKKKSCQMNDAKVITDNSHSHNIDSYNTNINGNTINININAYGKEDLSHITDKDYKILFKKCNSLIPALIELIHFNENKPENKNVFMSNIKSRYVNVYDGTQWNLMNKHELIDDIYDNKCIIIKDKFDDMKELLNKNIIELFNKFIDKHETKIMKKNMADKIQLMLYNNRNLIQK